MPSQQNVLIKKFSMLVWSEELIAQCLHPTAISSANANAYANTNTYTNTNTLQY